MCGGNAQNAFAKGMHSARLIDDDALVFMVVAGGDLLDAARRRVECLGLSNVLFTGPVPRAEIPSYFTAMDVAFAGSVLPG